MDAKKLLCLLISVMMLCSILTPAVFADSDSTAIQGSVYEFEESGHYDYSVVESPENPDGSAAYGVFSVTGELTPDTATNGFETFTVADDSAPFVYSYTNDLLTAPEDSWHLVEDKTKIVADIKLDDKIRFGALILQTSKDGENWINDVVKTNVFQDVPNDSDPFYSANSVQLSNGCYFRLIVAYELGIKTGESKVLMVTRDEYEYKKVAEVYQFYLHGDNTLQESDNTLRQDLGELSKAETGKGYSGNDEIGIKDPHYGWEIGEFFVSGYTRDTKDENGTPVFLKNVGDQVTLWFNLQQNIDALNGNEILSISKDADGYDQYFQTDKTDMGRGALIVRYTDEQGVRHEPEIYTNYLEANATTSADTIVKLFEEGDYEVALDYQIKKTPRKVGSIEVIPEYYDYRIFFRFSVRNGNCMVYPFDIVTGAELSDNAITPNGFKLDMAKSRYLTIDVKKSVVTEGAQGYVEDVRFNRPAKDGDEYVDEGIYTFCVKNLYTGEDTTKTIYVGDAPYMRALSGLKPENGMTPLQMLNSEIEQGATLADDGTIIMPSPSPEPPEEETPEPSISISPEPLPAETVPEASEVEAIYISEPEDVPDSGSLSETNTSDDESKEVNGVAWALGGGIAVLVCVLVIWMISKKRNGKQQSNRPSDYETEDQE